jgi:hypothetical protein
MPAPKKLGPKAAEDATVGQPCAACLKPFVTGDYTTFVVLGPGDDSRQQLRCRMGYEYDGVSVEVHFTCATGELP